MKSNKILYSIIGLLLLVVGFLSGSLLNNNGRYQPGDMYSMLDTKKGIFYIFRGKDFVVVDINTKERKVLKLNKSDENYKVDKQEVFRNLLE